MGLVVQDMSKLRWGKEYFFPEIENIEEVRRWIHHHVAVLGHKCKATKACVNGLNLAIEWTDQTTKEAIKLKYKVQEWTTSYQK
jgi:hypothetical protein